MLLTLQSAVEDVKESNAAEVSKIAKLASHGSLMGARGNSGVILSQIFRGCARAVEGKGSLTPSDLAAACEEAANAAYRAVNKPTEGTILTVAREAGRAAATAAGSPDANVPRVIAAAAAGARAAVVKTPGQLQILRDAGVVDAGGFGLQLILEGMLKSVEETEPLPATIAEAKPHTTAASQVSLPLPEGGWGYCTEFLIEGTNLDVELIRNQIEALGNSVMVVGEPELVKVHVHTDDPTRVINLAGGYGKLMKLNVGDMSTQHRRILETEGGVTAGGPPRPNGVRVKKGDVIGLINDRLEFAGSDYAEVVNKALGKLGPDSYELVTVYRGEQASNDEMKRLESEIRSSYPGLEVEVQQGGQQHYPFILSVE